MPRSQEIQVSVPVLLFTIGVGLLSGLGFGLVPAWRATRGDPSGTCSPGAAAAAGGRTTAARAG